MESNVDGAVLSVKLVDLDWDDPAWASAGLFTKVTAMNGAGPTWQDAVQLGGACLPPEAMAADAQDRFVVYGTRKNGWTPFAPEQSFGVCVEGSKLKGYDPCITDAQASHFVEMLARIEASQNGTFEAQLPEDYLAWRNGTPNGTPGRTRIFVHRVGYGGDSPTGAINYSFQRVKNYARAGRRHPPRRARQPGVARVLPQARAGLPVPERELVEGDDELDG